MTFPGLWYVLRASHHYSEINSEAVKATSYRSVVANVIAGHKCGFLFDQSGLFVA